MIDQSDISRWAKAITYSLFVFSSVFSVPSVVQYLLSFAVDLKATDSGSKHCRKDEVDTLLLKKLASKLARHFC